MKHFTYVFLASGLFFISLVSRSQNSNTNMELKTLKDSASYSIGVSIANNLKNQNIDDINVEALALAIKDVLNNQPVKVETQDAQKIINDFVTEQNKKKHEATLKAGEEFLANNAKRKGVITLASGVQYEVITMGDGPKPTTNSKVKTHYHGTLIDGRVFDSSVERGQPISFAVTGVIKGWTEILQLMPVGSKWKVYIPYDLAYGANPRPGGLIKPFDALVFEIELISIEQ